MKSGTASGCAAFTTQAGKAAQPDAKGRFLRPKRQGARRKTGGRMTRARRGNAVLAHSCVSLKGHFVRNGYKHDLMAVKGEGRFGRENASRGRRSRLYGGIKQGSSSQNNNYYFRPVDHFYALLIIFLENLAEFHPFPAKLPAVNMQSDKIIRG